MKIVIEAEPKEIAALVAEIQERQGKLELWDGSLPNYLPKAGTVVPIKRLGTQTRKC